MLERIHMLNLVFVLVESLITKETNWLNKLEHQLDVELNYLEDINIREVFSLLRPYRLRSFSTKFGSKTIRFVKMIAFQQKILSRPKN